MKGVSYTAWQKDAMLSPESDASLAAIRDTGANWIAICVWWFRDNVDSTVIEPDYTRYSASPESVIHAIQKSHELGMKVMLKPMVDLRDGTWRGEINSSSDWFNAYQGFINFWAGIAQQYNVELFSVGCELKNTVSEAASWRSIVQDVRNHHYSGPLTYSANHGQERNVSWWDEVDYIGIDAYYALTNSDDPSLDELKTSWKNRADSIEVWRNNNWPNMDIIFTEAGYQSVNGTNRTPWYTDPSTHPIDMLEQANCYEAMLSQCRQRAWWRGVFWWNWETSPDGGGPDDPYWTPQNKPAELIMSTHYSSKEIELTDIDSGLTSPSVTITPRRRLRFSTVVTRQVLAEFLLHRTSNPILPISSNLLVFRILYRMNLLVSPAGGGRRSGTAQTGLTDRISTIKELVPSRTPMI
jgi:hypothetical protein